MRVSLIKEVEPAIASADATQLVQRVKIAATGTTEDSHTYPEGGRDAWLVVFGAWCGLTASLGIYNTSGVFEAVISQVILPQDSASTLGWLSSTYAFVTICTLVGIFTLSICTSRLHESVTIPTGC